MRIHSPRKLELEYIQRMMAWLLWRPAGALSSGHAVQLGLGAAAITRFTHQVLRWRTTVVEINRTVIAACRLWFHLPADDERLAVVQADAARWVSQPEHLQTIDALSVDLYDHEAAHRARRRGLLRCLPRPAGAGRSDDGEPVRPRRQLRAQRCAGGAAFGASHVWQLAPTKEGNTVLVAGREVELPDRDTLVARADAIQAAYRLPAAPSVEADQALAKRMSHSPFVPSLPRSALDLPALHLAFHPPPLRTARRLRCPPRLRHMAAVLDQLGAARAIASALCARGCGGPGP